LETQAAQIRSECRIVFYHGQEDPDDQVNMSDALEGIRIVLVLPDRKEATVQTGLRLLPRLYCFMDSAVEETALVMNKLMRNAFNATD